MPCSGVLVVAGSGGVVKVMDTERWNTLASLPTPSDVSRSSPKYGDAPPRHRNDANVSATAIAADGPHAVVVQYANNITCCWDLQNPSQAAAKWEMQAHHGVITMLCAASSSCGSKATAQVYTTIGADGYARVWQQSQDSSSPVQLHITLRLEREAGSIHGPGTTTTASAVAAMSAADQMLAIGEPSGSVSIYILPSPTKCRLDVNHNGAVSSLAWGLDGDAQFLASGGVDGRVHVHCIRGERILPLKTLEAGSAVTCVVFLHAHADHSLILAVGEERGTCTFWCGLHTSPNDRRIGLRGGQQTALVFCRTQHEDDFQMLHKVQLQECACGSDSCKIVGARAVMCQRGIALMSRNSLIVLVEAHSGRTLQSIELRHGSPPTCMDSAGTIISCGHEDGSVRYGTAVQVASTELATAAVRPASSELTPCFPAAAFLMLCGARSSQC